MKWDYQNNLPKKGTYKPKGLKWDRYFLSGEHHKVPKDDIYEVLEQAIYDLVGLQGSNPYLSDYYVDHLNGRITLLNFCSSHWRGHKEAISDADIYARFYFCETEEDVFDMVLDGVGEITSFIRAFKGQYDYPENIPVYTASKDRLKRFTTYLAAHHYPKEGNEIWFESKVKTYHSGRLVELSPSKIVVALEHPLTCESYPVQVSSEMPEKLATKKGKEYILTSMGHKVMLQLLKDLSYDAYYFYLKPDYLRSVVDKYEEWKQKYPDQETLLKDLHRLFMIHTPTIRLTPDVIDWMKGIIKYADEKQRKNESSQKQ